MKINIKKISIICASALLMLYALFITSGLIFSPIINSYGSKIEELIKNLTGLEVNIKDLGITTTPNLTIGIRVKDFSVYVPEEKTPLIELENAKASLKLLPLIFKKIELANISAKEIEGNLTLNKNGQPKLLEYLPEQNSETTELQSGLPFGFKLSNHLPDIKVKEYKFAIISAENNNKYSVDGKNLKITDFVLDKRVKISSNGQIIFENQLISSYDIKIYNKIMPQILLDDLVFPKEVKINGSGENEQAFDIFNFNIIDVLKTINKNGLKADLKADIKTSGTFNKPIQNGFLEFSGISIISDGQQLPESYAKLVFKGNKTELDSILYTSPDNSEKTQLLGTIHTGQKPALNIILRSNAKFNSIIRLIDSIAQTFGKNDFETITATGGIDADFNITSDMKTVLSSGYLKIPDASINYGKYNILTDNLNGDIDLSNNNINIKQFGMNIMGNPMKIYGSISSDAVANLKIITDKLSIKGLIGLTGQVSILNDNNIKSGTLLLNADIKGKLTDIKPDIKLNIGNINIYNKPSQISLLLNEALVKFNFANNLINGDIDINLLKIIHDMASISIPNSTITITPKDINIKNSSIMINNSKINVAGSVKDYSNKNLNMDISANGNLAASDIAKFIPNEFKSMFPYSGSIPLSVKAKGNDKQQDLTFDLNLTPNGYVRFLDINKLKGKNSRIYADVKINNNAINFENSGIFVQSNKIISLEGGIKNLSDPNLNINISVPENISFPIPGMGNNTNITANGSANISGKPMTPKLNGKVNIAEIAIKDMDFILTNLVANMNGQGICGNATADKMKFGGIIGTNLSSKFSLNNFSTFNLNEIKAEAFGGKVSGKLTYDIPTFAFGVDIKGKNLNSTDAIYGAIGIQKALTGVLDFCAKLTSKGITDVEIIKNMKGNIDFNIENGRFISIGKLENLVAAQNITTNSILKSAVSALTTAANLQETNKFKTINGKISMQDGIANITYMNVSGPLMSYYVKGIYNILQNSAKLTILGRLDSKVISYLGPIGQLSVEKLLSYIPNFGSATAKYLKLLTQNPKDENIELIPALTTDSNSYKDFKVIYDGQLERATSVKSFKWLSTCDTSQMDLKQEVKNAAGAVKENVKSQIESTKNTTENIKSNVTRIVENEKQKVNVEKQSIEQAKNDIQNIKQNIGKSGSNLGKLLINAASNANKKTDTTSQTEQTKQPEAANSQTTTKNEENTTSNSDNKNVNQENE